MIRKEIWRKVGKINPNLLLVHTRAASQGFPGANKNNHPFVNKDFSLGLIHNGRIPEYEYQALKDKYEVVTDCDSEVLLRIIESSDNDFNSDYPEIGNRLEGIKGIFSHINEGHMAVAIGEKKETNRHLWLFRNHFRPIWIVDLREYIGQIFFVSEPRIWQDAVKECSERNFKQKLIEIPADQIWFFDYFNGNFNFKKFKVTKENSKPFYHDGEKIKVQAREIVHNVITKLKENDELPPVINKKENYNQVTSLNMKCNQIKKIIIDLEVTLENMIKENSIDQNNLNRIMDFLELERISIERTYNTIA